MISNYLKPLSVQIRISNVGASRVLNVTADIKQFKTCGFPLKLQIMGIQEMHGLVLLYIWLTGNKVWEVTIDVWLFAISHCVHKVKRPTGLDALLL